MSKIEAYKCDYCGGIYAADEMTGVIMKDDLFDVRFSHPLTPTPDKADVHFCLECYRLSVINHLPSDRERAKNEVDYVTKKDALSAVFKQALIFNAMNPKKAAFRPRKF